MKGKLMGTHAAIGTGTRSISTIAPEQQRRGALESFERQLCGLLDATMRETWLPMGFRVLVVQMFPAMREMIKKKRVALEDLNAHVTQLLEEAEPYKVFAKRSGALLALRALKAEIDSVRLAA